MQPSQAPIIDDDIAELQQAIQQLQLVQQRVEAVQNRLRLKLRNQAQQDIFT